MCLRVFVCLRDDPVEATPKTVKGQEIATAVCASTTVKAGGTGQLDFSLAWDMPVVQFKAGENKYSR